jgi:membrane protease YdiL (CAAX protease family)
MSILAAADVPVSATAVLLGLFAAAASLGVAWMVGILRNDKLDPTRRIPPDRPMAPLVGALFAAVVVWLVLGPTLLGQRGTPGTATTAPATQPVSLFGSDRELVIANAVVPSAAFVVLLCGNALARSRVGQRLGFDVRRAPVGVTMGVAGLLIAMPVVYGSMALAEWVYRQIGYNHPPAHDLLKTMGETPDVFVRNLAIVVAAVVAPLWEELLFRGHVQTLLREVLVRQRDSESPARPRPSDSWIAILLTSLLFAAIHHPWTFPPIFVLSVCFGFAYERTGNLWTPIAMHAGFNGLMTAYFLMGL